MNLLRRPLSIIRAHRRTYAAVNALIYGPLLLSFVLGAIFPRLSDNAVDAMTAFASTSPLRGQVGAAHEGTVLELAAVILISTVFFGALGMASIPSLLIPYAGVAIHVVFAIGLGLTYAPHGGESWMVFWAHFPTLVLELQGYILVLLGTVLLARYWLSPQANGFTSRRAGYRRGLVESAWLYVPALGVLIVGALYEGFEFLVLLG